MERETGNPMPDYIYLLENRLSADQQHALKELREVAREAGHILFLTGSAVRDLTSGYAVRDLEVAIQGNALKLQKAIAKRGAEIWGEDETTRTLYLCFPGTVRVDLVSTTRVEYPKPGKPVYHPASIHEFLRTQDFTGNSMALSLNEGSYGLLMDPLNGVADIENRELRLVSNYGFIEDPVRMIRAARLAARLGWQMEEKTRARYETGKGEGYISAMSAWQRGYEAEEIVHEEEPLRVMRGLEHEGWMKQLASGWSSAKANAAELEKLREGQMQLQLRGINADASAGHFPRRPRKMLMRARPEVVLWVAYSTKNAVLQAKFKNFYTEWPQARQKIPYTLMQEMRIVPGLAGFDELVEKVFFELMDGKLGTEEAMKAYLGPYSPPAPPPPVHLRRARATKKDGKVAKARKKAVAGVGQPENGGGLEEVAAAAHAAEGLP